MNPPCTYVFTIFLYFLKAIEIPTNPCHPSPCGPNSICKEHHGAGSCTCIQDYFGDPYAGCRPECVTNNDCPKDKACLGKKCRDPCPGSCGINAECQIINHNPSCLCLPGFTGNALRVCHQIVTPSKIISANVLLIFIP